MNDRRSQLFLVLAICHLAVMPTTSDAEPPSDPALDEIMSLVSILESDASDYVKAKTCNRLAVIGDDRAVPTLANLLDDENLSNYARHALERNSGPKARKALRQAVARARGDLLVGVIGSIGHVQDEAAVEHLSGYLTSENQAIAMATARALGRIGTPKSGEVLLAAFQAALADGPQSRRDVAASGCVLCARSLAQKGNLPLALKLCDVIRNSDVSNHVRLPALHSAIVLRGKKGAVLLYELLESDEWSDFQVAMRAVREMEMDISEELISRFDKQESDHQVILLAALADLGSKVSLPTFIKAAREGETVVRLKAFEVLSQLADDSAIPVLVQATRDSDKAVADAAREALLTMRSERVDGVVLALLAAKDPVRLRVAVDLADRRLLHAAAARLWQLTEHEDKELRIAAIHALGTTTRMEDWPQLIRATTDEEDSDERKAARTASKIASGRISQAGSAQIVTKALDSAKPSSQQYLLELLGHIGGPLALETVAAAARSNDDMLQDAATRVLGNWTTSDVAPVLYELTTTLKDNKYRIRTLRGYIRVARHLSLPIGERLDLCETALRLATRSDEKLLVLEVLRVHGVPRGMRIARTQLEDKDNEVMEQAARVIVILARGYVREFPGHAEKSLVPALERATNARVQEIGQEILEQARERLAQKESQ